jgi:hypothetical protein
MSMVLLGLAVLLTGAFGAQAAYVPGSSNLLVNGAYLRAGSRDSGQGLTGWGVDGAYEMTTPTARWAGGFGLGFLRLSDEVQGVETKGEIVDGKVTYNTFPLSATPSFCSVNPASWVT